LLVLLGAVVAAVMWVAIFQAPTPQASAPPATTSHVTHHHHSTGSTTPPPATSPALTVLTTTCEACHTLWGKGGTIGPNLNQVFAGKLNVVPNGQPLNAAWLTKWITNPKSQWSGAIMPPGLVSGSQLTAVVQYLEGIHTGATKAPA
jgi:cytochrome c2